MAQASHAATAVLHVYREEDSVKEYLEDLQEMRKVSFDSSFSALPFRVAPQNTSLNSLITLLAFSSSIRFACLQNFSSQAASVNVDQSFPFPLSASSSSGTNSRLPQLHLHLPFLNNTSHQALSRSSFVSCTHFPDPSPRFLH